MITYLILAVSVLSCLLALIGLFKSNSSKDLDQQLQHLEKQLFDEMRANRTETQASINTAVKNFSDSQISIQKQVAEIQDSRLRQLNEQLTIRQKALEESLNRQLLSINEQFKSFSVQSEQKLENIRTTMETRITNLQNENTKKLEQMRETVDEKLQKTLDDKLKQSFSLVSERLEQVYKGLGEMQTLANGVGDLKKVLSNVKTRGILGEIQLGAILEQILSREQFDENVATKPGSADRVEYAVKLPGDGKDFVYLPVDAKFPSDAYHALLEAYDSADASKVDAAAKVLEQRIKAFAKDIHDKYIQVPYTTDFAIMFLPVEGLYAEVVRRGLIEKLQADYKINIAGPTTMAALLNSLQMGFKTLAIQKRSSEVWQVLSSVKNEFDKFESALAQTQNRLNQASNELEKLVGTRTRQIIRKLESVQTLPEIEPLSLTSEDEE